MEQFPFQPEQSTEEQEGPLARIKKVEDSRIDVEKIKKNLETLGGNVADAGKLEILVRVVEKYPDSAVSKDIATYLKSYDKPVWKEDIADHLLDRAERILGPEEIEKLKNSN